MFEGDLDGGQIPVDDAEMEEVAALGVDGVDVAFLFDEHVERLEEPAGGGANEKRGSTFGVESLSVDTGREGEADHHRITDRCSLKEMRKWNETIN